ncbi:spermatogenesis-associated protein 31A1-like [Choloepus didactylus]|uniref:spermatogenesis-associated protein 31A1-like n=1 Tax=Choloepus didactylus TaxID=27675 RepID=UPI00189F629E|nr:spermatogenesis-associated protein 31A1-like [Choloepus didactylus]
MVPSEAHLPCEELTKDDAPTVAPLVSSTLPLTKSPIPLASTLSAEPQEDQSNLKTIPLSLVPESSPGNRFCLASSIPAFLGLDRSCRLISALFWWWAAAKALLFPASTHCKSQQDHLSQHPKKISFWGGPEGKHVEARSLSFLSPDVQKLLEVQVTKRVESKILKEREKDGLFSKQMSTDYHLNSLGNMLKSLGKKQDTTVPQPFWNTKGKPEQLLSPQQFSYPKNLGDHIQCNCSQLFWGLPSLHSESLGATAWVSRTSSPRQSPVLFNGNREAYPVKIQAKSPLLLQPHTLPQPKAQPRTLTPTMAQSQPPLLVEVQTQDNLQSSLPILPSSPSLIKHCEVSCPTCQNEIPSLNPSENEYLDWPLLQQQMKSRKAKRPQEASSSPTTNLPQDSQGSRFHRSISFLPYPSSHDSQKQLQQHLQERLIKDHWGLPCRVIKSQGLKQTRVRSPETCQAKEQRGTSEPSVLPGPRSKDDKEMGPKHPESIPVRDPAKFQLRKDPGRCWGQINLSMGLESFPVKFPETDSKEESKSELKGCPKSDSGSNLPKNLVRKQVENALKIHLGRKLGQIIEGRIPVSVRRSWFSVSHTLPKTDSQMEIRNLASTKDRKYHVNTSQELSFCEPSTQQLLEAHIIRFRVRQRWGLPLQILELSEAQVPPPQQSTSPTPAYHASGTQIAEAATLLGETPQACREMKVLTTKSNPTREGLLPAQSSVCEEVQRVFRWAPPGDDHQLSEAPLTAQEGRQSPQPLTPRMVSRPTQGYTVLGTQRGSLELTPGQVMVENRLREESGSHAPRAPCPGVTMLETVIGSQYSRAEESREAVKAVGSPVLRLQYRDILRTNEQADPPVTRVDLSGLGSPRNSKSPPSPRTEVAQVPKVKLPSKFKLKGEEEQQSHLQDWLSDVLLQECPVDMPLQDRANNMILQDCATDTLLQGCPRDVLFAADILSSQMPQSCPQSMSSADMSTSQVLSDLFSARERTLGLQDPRISQFQDLWKNQGKTGAPTEREDCSKPTPGKHEEDFLGLGRSQARGVTQLGYIREVIDTFERKYPQLLLEKGQAPPEKYFRKLLRHYLRCIYPNKKIKEQEDYLQKDKPELASVQSQGPVKSKSLISEDNKAAETQALMAAVGQILVEKLSLHALELSQQQEKEAARVLVDRCSCYHRAPSYSEQRRVSSDSAHSHHGTSESRRCRGRERQARGQNGWKFLRLNDENMDLRHSPPPHYREPGFPVSSHHHRPRIPGDSSGTHHCPRHYLQRDVFSDPPANAFRAFPGSRKCQKQAASHITKWAWDFEEKGDSGGRRLWGLNSEFSLHERHSHACPRPFLSHTLEQQPLPSSRLCGCGGGECGEAAEDRAHPAPQMKCIRSLASCMAPYRPLRLNPEGAEGCGAGASGPAVEAGDGGR